jgi:uncharacterized metal-binding protein YceD (DUF177 family)
MSLKFNLRQLEEDELRLKGELPVAELDLGVTDELVRAEKPLRYHLTLQKLHDSILVTGKLVLPLDCQCGRCLKPITQDLVLNDWALHLPLEGEDKVSIENDSVDLTPFVREDILLDFPQHPLCKPECAGLKNKNTVRAVAAGEKPASVVWAELDKLKLK